MFRFIARRYSSIKSLTCGVKASAQSFFESRPGKGRQFRARHKAGLTYEICESRDLLAGIVFDASIGQALVGGTQQADFVQVTQSGDTVTIVQSGFETQTFSASELNEIVFVGLGGDDTFENQTGITALAYGQNGNDILIGGSGNDRLFGNGGDDTIRGNGGDDFLVAGIGDDDINAGAGDDRVLGIDGSNSLEGGVGDDLVFGGSGDDVITDVSGSNTLAGNDGNDSIAGGSGQDLIFGGNGGDFLRGFAGDDFLFAQAGDDVVFGGLGDDTVAGHAGDDVLQGEQGNDRILGGGGNDRANYSGSLVDYDVSPSGPVNVVLDDLRGPNFGLEDLVISVEQLAFADGTRTPNETLNPVAPPPIDGTIEVVTIQPVIASNSDGSNQAEFFGNAQQEAEIKRLIDEIYSQANIDIEFLEPRFVDDTFINVGAGGERSASELNQIVSRGDGFGVGSSDRLVIDLYFVETVPGFSNLGESVANGLAFVGAPGSAVHIGDSLVGFQSGREVAARVVAHEIGHNLGLAHFEGAVDNLLAETGSGDQLTEGQAAIALSSPLSQRTTG